MNKSLQLPRSKSLDLGIRPMRLTFHDHHQKSYPLQDTLIEMGAELVFTAADLMLIDHDGTEYYQNFINQLCGLDTRVVIYPHGAGVFPAWDGVYKPHPRTVAVLVVGSGQKEAMAAYGYPNPVHSIGWFWCEQKPFQPPQGMKTLFAPVHCLNNGYIHPSWMGRNKDVYSLLLSREVDLKVRHVGHMRRSGIYPAYGVEYSLAKHETMLSDIDEADVVIANGTFAHLAIARGKPTIMFDEGMPYQDHGKPAVNWNLYKDIAHYPLQFFGCDIDANVSDDKSIADWKSRFIGEPMKPEVLATTLREIYDV